MSAPELAACPFCGGEAGRWLWQGLGYSGPKLWMLHHCCRLSEIDDLSTYTIQIRERTREAVIDAWNRRADLHDPTPPAAPTNEGDR